MKKKRKYHELFFCAVCLICWHFYNQRVASVLPHFIPFHANVYSVTDFFLPPSNILFFSVEKTFPISHFHLVNYRTTFHALSPFYKIYIFSSSSSLFSRRHTSFSSSLSRIDDQKQKQKSVKKIREHTICKM